MWTVISSRDVVDDLILSAYMECFNARDADAIARLFGKNGSIKYDAECIQGRLEIAEWYRDFFQTPSCLEYNVILQLAHGMVPSHSFDDDPVTREGTGELRFSLSGTDTIVYLVSFQYNVITSWEMAQLKNTLFLRRAITRLMISTTSKTLAPYTKIPF
ncbi:MAG: hypothetical protein G01um101466_435 [Parcubacteria group bacterium Gr01-1014_66]|nr:MAG: hypothetical protein G01um101466_435 [Parcubacteria group bacterium Gr01-1014_66]